MRYYLFAAILCLGNFLSGQVQAEQMREFEYSLPLHENWKSIKEIKTNTLEMNFYIPEYEDTLENSKNFFCVIVSDKKQNDFNTENLIHSLEILGEKNPNYRILKSDSEETFIEWWSTDVEGLIRIIKRKAGMAFLSYYTHDTSHGQAIQEIWEPLFSQARLCTENP